jgi:hypothetical protein
VFTWRYLDDSGSEAGRSDDFPDQEAAEAWLGDTWRKLLDEGAEFVELTEDGDVVYRMSLREAPQ